MPERNFQFEEFLRVWLFSGMFLFSALFLYFLNQETISPLQMQLNKILILMICIINKVDNKYPI